MTIKKTAVYQATRGRASSQCFSRLAWLCLLVNRKRLGYFSLGDGVLCQNSAF